MEWIPDTNEGVEVSGVFKQPTGALKCRRQRIALRTWLVALGHA